jgi:hypothetical protein
MITNYSELSDSIKADVFQAMALFNAYSLDICFTDPESFYIFLVGEGGENHI